MKIERLVTMANQIGDFFRTNPDASQAKKDIANHLHKFWALNMRQDIVIYIEEMEGTALHPIVSDAIKENRSTLV